MQTPEEKLSLEEMKAHRDRELHNSNMLNLANVISNIDEQLEYIEKKKNRLTELKAEIEAKIQANNVSSYTLEIVTNDEVQDQNMVVGTCENGTKKIIYQKNDN